MERRTFLQGIGASAVVAAARQNLLALSSPLPRDRPNLLIIMSDQHSPHILGCAGDPVIRTPNLDALASRGVRFEHTYCAAPVCVPSRASFLTGQIPSATRVWSNDDRLCSDIPTFAHSLQIAGYDTTLIGRMLFYGMDQWHGFRRRLVGDVVQYPYNKLPIPANMMKPPLWATGYGKTAFQLYDEAVTHAAVRYLREQRSGTRPFCAVVGFFLPHAPTVCPKSEWDYYINRVTVPQIPPGYLQRLHPAMQQLRKALHLENISPEQARAARAGYYGLVTVLDQHIGRILEELERHDFARNTIVIYTSDHGDSMGENGLWWKMNMFEGSVTVPLIASSPQRWRPAVRSEIASLLDVAPTLLDLGGAAPLPNANGRSLIPLLENRNGVWENEAFSEFPPSDGVPTMRMVRSGKWKLVYYHGERPQLFDLETDPRELHDLGADAAYAAVREQLTQRVLADWSPDYVESARKKQSAEESLIKQWEAQVRPPVTIMWEPPPNANRYTQVP